MKLLGYSIFMCPVCQGDNTHIDEAHISARSEDEEFKEIRVNAITGQINPGAETGPGDPGRRQRISLLGWCELCGHKFAIVFRQHKGETELELFDNGQHLWAD